MQDNMADGLAAVASHPVTVQVINQGPGIWGNVATGLITGAIAIAGIWLTHWFAQRREHHAMKDKLEQERYFIATGLVFLLERFSQRCVYSAYEAGYNDPKSGYIRVEYSLPEFSYDGIAGDWRSLPQGLMYRLSQMPVLHQEARQSIVPAFDNDSPEDGDNGLHELNRQSCRLGLRAIRLSRELRRLCAMPDDDLSTHNWCAWRMLSTARARVIDTDLHHAHSNLRIMAALSQLAPVASTADTGLSDQEKGFSA